ncbi:MAG: D-aminoacylase [Bacteroidetes bacterium]|nr:D-aminoacylase [Bacteroidota bacterium]
MKRRKFIKSASLAGASALLLNNKTFSNIIKMNYPLDILVSGGFIIDGIRGQRFKADIGIKNGRIVDIGNLIDANGEHTINASGLIVSPGFIDIHSHTDLDLIPNPKAESKIRQGVTTEITGQDGFSEGPVSERDIERKLKNFKDQYGEDLPWRSLGEFLDDFSTRKFSVNLASMLGMGTLREVVVGMDDRPASSDELIRMKYEVEKGMGEGAVGLSSGLEYTPGSFAPTDELIELCKSAPGKYRIYSTHMRNEDDTVLEAVDEAIKIARESNSKLLLSHLKVSGKTNWHKADAVIEKMEAAIKEGLEVHADRYTYVAYHTGLENLFPLWARDGGTNKFMDRLNDAFLLKKMKLYTEAKVSNLDGDWNGVLLSSIGKKEFKLYQGKTIKQLGEEFGTEGFDAAVRILKETQSDVMMMGFGMEEESTVKILAHPRVMISSDAGSHAPYPPMSRSIAHPRAYGTFPRAIAKYVREKNICSLEEMIKKMTSMPAEKIGLVERGVIKKNYFADITIFDYEKIQDKATFTDSHQYPEGIPFVIVNGKLVINNGEHTGSLPGMVIKG